MRLAVVGNFQRLGNSCKINAVVAYAKAIFLKKKHILTNVVDSVALMEKRIQVGSGNNYRGHTVILFVAMAKQN